MDLCIVYSNLTRNKFSNFFDVIELFLQVKAAFINIGLKELTSSSPPKGNINPTVN